MLNLVIGGVGKADPMNPAITADLRQCSVPQFAADHLQTLSARILLFGHNYALRHKPDSKHRTRAPHKVLIQLRFISSQPVIDVRNDEATWIHSLHPDHRMQHPHGVTAAGDGNDKGFTCRHTTPHGQRLGHETRELFLSGLGMILKFGRAHLSLNPAKKLAHPTISPLGFKNVGAVFW